MDYFITSSTNIGESNTFTGNLADSRRWPKEDREASLLRGEFITTSESPSSINSAIPNSCAKVIALAAAMASTMFGENGRGACSDSEAIAFPWQSWTTTPRPALPNSGKTAPSKFSLKQFRGGGLHWARGWGRVTAEGWMRGIVGSVGKWQGPAKLVGEPVLWEKHLS